MNHKMYAIIYFQNKREIRYAEEMRIVLVLVLVLPPLLQIFTKITLVYKYDE